MTQPSQSSLTQRHCKPCKGGVPALKGEQLQRLAAQTPDWKVVDEHHLERTFSFPDFVGALLFANRVGEVAEREGHHPDLLVSWGKLGVKTYTHAVGGLTENDFILASHIDALLREG